MKVLIIEDETALARVLQEKFEWEKYEVKTAPNGEDGEELIKSFRPDIVLLDLILPRKSGFDVLDAMKKDPEVADIPVIILSNLGEDSDIKKAIQMGASDYFVKAQHPISEVVEKVKAALVKGK